MRRLKAACSRDVICVRHTADLQACSTAACSSTHRQQAAAVGATFLPAAMLCLMLLSAFGSGQTVSWCLMALYSAAQCTSAGCIASIWGWEDRWAAADSSAWAPVIGGQCAAA